MDPDVEVTGRYITSMVNSAGEVSPVFGRKMEELLGEFGLADPEPESWYSAQDFAEAVDSATDQIGSKTVAQAGEEMGKDVPKDEFADPHEALAGADAAQQAAYRGGQTTRPAGGYTYEKVDATEAHLGVTEPFPYQEEIAKGALVGILKDMVERESQVSAEETDTKPTEDPEKAPEREAYVISW